MNIASGLGGSVTPDTLVRLSTIALKYGMDEEGFELLVERAYDGEDENVEYDNVVLALTDELDELFTRKAAIYGAGTINRTVEYPRTRIALAQLDQQLRTFRGTDATLIGTTYTTEQSANYDIVDEQIAHVVTYYNYAAGELGIPQIG